MFCSGPSTCELETLSRIVNEIKPSSDFVEQLHDFTAKISEVIRFNRCIVLHDREGRLSSRGFVYRDGGLAPRPSGRSGQASSGPPLGIRRYVACFDTLRSLDHAFYWREAGRTTSELDPRAADLLNDMRGSEGVAAGVRTVVGGADAETLLQLESDTGQFSKRESLLVSFIAFHLHSAFTFQPVDERLQDGLFGISLTVKEKDVLKWVVEGKTSWEISRILATSERTVKFHLKNVYSKLNVSNRAQAVAVAGRMGLI